MTILIACNVFLLTGSYIGIMNMNPSRINEIIFLFVFEIGFWGAQNLYFRCVVTANFKLAKLKNVEESGNSILDDQKIQKESKELYLQFVGCGVILCVTMLIIGFINSAYPNKASLALYHVGITFLFALIEIVSFYCFTRIAIHKIVQEAIKKKQEAEEAEKAALEQNNKSDNEDNKDDEDGEACEDIYTFESDLPEKTEIISPKECITWVKECYETLNLSRHETDEEILSMLEQIGSMPGVTEIGREEDKLRIIVKVRLERDGILYDVGCFGISFYLSGTHLSPELQCDCICLRSGKRPDFSNDLYDYPSYAKEGEEFCFGDKGYNICTLLQTGNLLATTSYMIAALHHINPEDEVLIDNCFRKILPTKETTDNRREEI